VCVEVEDRWSFRRWLRVELRKSAALSLVEAKAASWTFLNIYERTPATQRPTPILSSKRLLIRGRIVEIYYQSQTHRFFFLGRPAAALQQTPEIQSSARKLGNIGSMIYKLFFFCFCL
jgi:hypothetical protein